MDEGPARSGACGRPTRSGLPCKAEVHGRAIACKIHTTEQERTLADACERGYREGYERGRESAAYGERLRVEHLERRVREPETRLDRETRIFEVDGDQVVGVGGYAYRWDMDHDIRVHNHPNRPGRIPGGSPCPR
ncbi:hypothetical protein [Saccharothrix xinjiangensis]|uniref:Uncharacterized protein n=1 Tax=Saccharothrix xinjiangensis TaxID=204798 RepID=A0ABV9XZ18_9PSEU